VLLVRREGHDAWLVRYSSGVEEVVLTTVARMWIRASVPAPLWRGVGCNGAETGA
jgi:hypothetical protein